MPKTKKFSVGNALYLVSAGVRTALTFGLWDAPVRFIEKSAASPSIPSNDLENFGLDEQKLKSDFKKAFALYWRERLEMPAPENGDINPDDPALIAALNRYYEKNVQDEITVSAVSSALEINLRQLKSISELAPEGRL